MNKENWFEKQVKEAKEEILSWPKWMQKTCRFDGNPKENLNGK